MTERLDRDSEKQEDSGKDTSMAAIKFPRKTRKIKERERHVDYYLNRLLRLHALVAKHEEHLNKEGIGVLRHAIGSTTFMLRDLGAGGLSKGINTEAEEKRLKAKQP